jgi:hypothetical protein
MAGITMLGSNVLSAHVRTNTAVIDTSTAGGETYALSEIISQLTQEREVLSNFYPGPQVPVKAFVDCKPAVDIANAYVHRSKSKHMGYRLASIKEAIARSQIEVVWVPTGEQLADFFTKSLPLPAFTKLRDILMPPFPWQL